MEEIYILEKPEMPWGDYGRILLSGMTAHQPRRQGRLQLERTGPFLPLIALSGIGDIVVADAFKVALERSGLSGCAFRPVIKRHIVHLRWEQWNRSLDGPPEYPEGGGPENYILRRPHDPDIAAAMGEVWELVLGEHAQSTQAVPPDGLDSLPRWEWPERAVVRETWDGTDWFRVPETGYIYLSARARRWLGRTADDWIATRPAPVR